MPNALTVADVVELWVWGSGRSMTDSQLEADIDAAFEDEAIDLGYKAVGESAEDLAEQVFEEILARQQLLGDSYPFACDGNRIRFLQPAGGCSSYIFCLLLSHLPHQLIQLEQRARQFETLAMSAAKAFFGGEALRIGAPWDTQVYEDLLKQVLELLPSLGNIDPSIKVVAGDRGWDVIVVKDFGDKRFPKFVALGNCATGRNDWKRKGLDTSPDFFWECFQRQRPGTWITFSAVPFLMSEDARHRKADKTNITFDRHRICELAPTMNDDASLWVEAQRNNASDVPLDSDL